MNVLINFHKTKAILSNAYKNKITMEIGEKQAKQSKPNTDAFRKRKTGNIERKKLSPDHPSKISTRQDSCSTQGHLSPPSSN